MSRIPRSRLIIDAEEAAKVAGFAAKYYIDPVYRRLYLDRKNLILSEALTHPLPELDKEIQDEQRLDGMVEMSRHPLLAVRTVFPFVVFPDDVIVDINKVSIIFREFFATEQVHSVLIKDISDVLVETNLLFATLKIVDVGYTDRTIDVKYLKRSDGEHARKLIQGLMTAHRNGIDLTRVAYNDLHSKLESLGASSE